MRRKYSKRFSREEMAQIVAEYQASDLTRDEIAEKYGINSPSSISNWIRLLSNEKNSLPLHRECRVAFSRVQQTKDNKGMEKTQYASIEDELKALREELARKNRELDWEKKRSMALETLIDIAERHGMPVKKCGAKQ